MSEAEDIAGLSPLYVRFDPGKWPEPGAVVLTNFDPEVEFAERA